MARVAQDRAAISDDEVVESQHLIPLKTYRLSPRKARLELKAGFVDLYLPTYFGRRRFVVPLDELAVCDLESPFLQESPVEDVFCEPISLPYLFTTGPVTAPTLLLLFVSPQRVPPLRAVAALAPNTDLPFGWTSTRFRNGAYVDGVLLRAPNTAEATRRLVEAGASEVNDPARFLREHRERVTDPVEAAQVIADDTRRARLDLVATGALYASFIGGIVITGAEQLPLTLLALPAAGIVGGLAIRRAATR